MGGIAAFAYGVLSYGAFFLTFLYLIGFLSNLVVPKSVDVGPSSPIGIALLINLALIAVFGLQHSIMARPGFKRWWTRVVPRSIERSTYVLLSSLALILLFWLWQPVVQVVWQADAAWARAVLWAVFWGGVGIVLASTFIIDHFDLFGLRQVTLRLLNKPYAPPGFKVTYFYKFVRHPLYVGWLMVFWGTPTMTVGHFLFAAGLSAYILIGIRYEERDLARYLGEDYVRYRRKVPMLVPRFGKVHETVKGKPSQPAEAR